MDYDNRYEMLAVIIQSAGIQTNLKGYTYLKDAVLCIAENPELMHQYMKVYRMISEKFDVQPASIDRAIRHAINTAYDKHTELLKAFFPYPTERPSNSEFISLAADRFVNQLMKSEYSVRM